MYYLSDNSVVMTLFHNKKLYLFGRASEVKDLSANLGIRTDRDRGSDRKLGSILTKHCTHVLRHNALIGLLFLKNNYTNLNLVNN